MWDDKGLEPVLSPVGLWVPPQLVDFFCCCCCLDNLVLWVSQAT